MYIEQQYMQQQTIIYTQQTLTKMSNMLLKSIVKFAL